MIYKNFSSISPLFIRSTRSSRLLHPSTRFSNRSISYTSRAMASKPTPEGQAISEVAHAEGGTTKGSASAQLQSELTKQKNAQQSGQTDSTNQSRSVLIVIVDNFCSILTWFTVAQHSLKTRGKPTSRKQPALSAARCRTILSPSPLRMQLTSSPASTERWYVVLNTHLLNTISDTIL